MSLLHVFTNAFNDTTCCDASSITQSSAKREISKDKRLVARTEQDNEPIKCSRSPFLAEHNRPPKRPEKTIESFCLVLHYKYWEFECYYERVNEIGWSLD